MKTANVLVVDTYVVHERRLGQFFYELHLAPDREGDAPRTILVTRNEEAYELALAAEGTPARFTATWHRGTRNGSKPCQVLDRLELMS